MYQSKGTWDPASLTEISQSLPVGTVVTLIDPSGKQIATLSNMMDDMMHSQSGMSMGMSMSMSSSSITSWKTKTLTVSGPQGTLATAYIRYPSSAPILNPQDVLFQSSVFYSLLFAGNSRKKLNHNAYRYSDVGGLMAITLSQASQFIEIKIKNTGIGIPEEDLPLIFERFYRADKSRTRETGGTGIGLALVHQITDLHRGTITAKSKAGQETEFTVILPKNIKVADTQFSRVIHRQ